MIKDLERVVEPELERVIAVAYGGFPEPLKNRMGTPTRVTDRASFRYGARVRNQPYLRATICQIHHTNLARPEHHQGRPGMTESGRLTLVSSRSARSRGDLRWR